MCHPVQKGPHCKKAIPEGQKKARNECIWAPFARDDSHVTWGDCERGSTGGAFFFVFHTEDSKLRNRKTAYREGPAGYFDVVDTKSVTELPLILTSMPPKSIPAAACNENSLSSVSDQDSSAGPAGMTLSANGCACAVSTKSPCRSSAHSIAVSNDGVHSLDMSLPLPSKTQFK